MPILIPISMAAVAAGSAISAFNKIKKAERRLEALNDADKPNESIVDYYNKALSRYSPNPYNSNLFTAQKRNIERGTAQGLADAQTRKGGLASVGALVQVQNDSLLNAAAAAEGQQGQQLGQLGQAAGAKAGEERRIFENKYNLLAMKAGQAAQAQNMQTQSMFNSLGNAASIGFGGNQESMFNNRYGSQGAGAYNYAQNNGMSFGQYRRQGNKVGNSLMNFGY